VIIPVLDSYLEKVQFSGDSLIGHAEDRSRNWIILASMDLPDFKYHPNPIATGSIVPSVKVCPVCRESRGYAYDGVPYGTKEVEHICPWCIADGSAHEKFQVEFTDPGNVGGYGRWETVSKEVVAEVAFRTPGFASWQQERWFTHCGDAAVFLGPMGKEELEQMGPEAIEIVRKESGQQGVAWQQYFSRLNRKFNATAYLFRCRHCRQLGGYSDCD
jgi:hypothetical protein